MRLRCAIAEGADLRVVYKDDLDTDRLCDPVAMPSPFSLSRALVVKHSHSFGC